MKKIELKFITLLVLLLFPTAIIIGQNGNMQCNNEIIKFNYSQNTIRFQVGKEKITFKNSLTGQNEVNLSVECIFNGFNMIITTQNGNEYEIHNYIFQKKCNEYFLESYYTKTSNRNSENLSGFLTNQISFKNFKGIADANKISKTISYRDGFQSIEKEYIDYYKQVNLDFKTKNFKNTKLFTNEFVLNSLNVFDYLNAKELNNLGYYALEAGAYSNAKVILLKVIKKYPNRVTAYLNLADAYYFLKMESDAKKYYSGYIAKMKEQNKDLNKIPERAIIRSK